ncbi:MAG: helix-turn-helix domain-containing protein [Lachnospiraceae bacterium]|nr:helix-turn-helix domain-containing protein [Lachnospiraceae bacterium]
MEYVTGKTIRRLREKKRLTQRELAEKLMVSDKTVSKWETDRGLPDIGMIGELSGVLGVSIAELLTGDCRENENPAGNMKKNHFYVCPVCGNVITSVGRGTFHCCGILLPEQEAENMDEGHDMEICTIDDEYCMTMNHPMSKEHYISFLAYVTSSTVEIIKLYPEQDICVRFRKKGHGWLYGYCNRHGLFRKLI